MIHIKVLLSSICLIAIVSTASGQILHTESFTVILDTTKTIKGSLTPDFKFKNLVKDLFELENIADLSARIGKNAFTVANKIEIAKFGKETILSGGYVYAEYREIFEKVLSLEYYAQIQWAEARGLERKYAFGVNSRWRLIYKESMGLFVGIGPFYEYERWNYDGVKNSETILDTSPIQTEAVKLGSYVSLKYEPLEKIFVDVSIYYQSNLTGLFNNPRLASSSKITYQLTKHLGFSIMYQNIYQPIPTVPIDELFHHVVSGVTISF